MKTQTTVLGILGLSMLALNVAAAPKNISSAARYNATFVLAPTEDAAARAKGTANVKAEIEEGSQTGTVSLRVQGLSAGEYALVGTRAFDGSFVDLGTFTVDDRGNRRGLGRSNVRNELELPEDLDATDLSALSVEDEDGIVLLTGDLSDTEGKSKATFDGTVPVVGGPAAPNANGFAKLRSSVRNGERTDRLTMVVFDVPPSSTFRVEVDWIDVGTVTSNKKGKLLVKTLPSDLDSIGMIRLVDEGANEVARATF